MMLVGVVTTGTNSLAGSLEIKITPLPIISFNSVHLGISPIEPRNKACRSGSYKDIYFSFVYKWPEKRGAGKPH